MSLNANQQMVAEDLPPPRVAPALAAAQPPPIPDQAQDDRNANGASAYVARYRLESRTATEPVVQDTPIIEVPVNFQRLGDQVVKLLNSAFGFWDILRERVVANQDQVDAHIANGCVQLTYAFIYLLYSYLREKAGRYNSSKSDIYRQRHFFDHKREVPIGLAYLIECFGITQALDAFGNCRFLHVWDGQDKDHFGYKHPRVVFSDSKLNGFISTLSRCGVRMRTINTQAVTRTPWDSLLIYHVGHGYYAHTTYPLVEYDLPRDVFLAAGICFQSTMTNKWVIKFYAPRMAQDEITSTTTALGTPAATPATISKKRKVAASDDVSTITVNDCSPCNHLQMVSETGVCLTVSGFTKDASGQETPKYDTATYTYGSGGVADAMTIKSVARGISDYEITGFYRSLFRHGY
jgi:hypothetical protein